MARRALGSATLAVVQAVEAVHAGEEVVVACSGGSDSVALAAAVALVAKRRSFPARAVVVDHGLQAGSDAWAARVAERLAGVGLAAVVRRVVVDLESPVGLEAAAREARYAALTDEARESGRVYLGHTLDDQAETVLLGLARGSGARSLAGMPRERGRFVRPLLGLRSSVTTQACRELGLAFDDDPHNVDPRFTRVRVRATVLPTLEAELGPGVAEALARTSDLLRADTDCLDALAAEARADLGDQLAVAALTQLPAAISSRVVRAWLVDHGAAEVGKAHLDAVWTLVDAWSGQRWVDVPGLRVFRRDGRLVVERP